MTVFCEANDIKLQANIVPGYTSRFDSFTDIYIQTVSDQIRNFCNRNFDLTSKTEYRMSPDSFNYPEPFRIIVAEKPIVPGTLFINYDPRGQFITDVSSITELVEDTDYVVDYENGEITIITQGLCYHQRGLKLEYNGGYAVTAGIVQVPAPIKNGCILQTVFMLQRVAAAQTGQSQEKANRGGNSHMFSGDAMSGLTGEVMAMVREFRVPLIGSR